MLLPQNNFYGGGQGDECQGEMCLPIRPDWQTTPAQRISQHANTSATLPRACNFCVPTRTLVCSLPVLCKLALGFPTEFKQSSATLFLFVFTGARGFIAQIEEIAYVGDFEGTSLYSESSFPGRATSSNTTHRKFNLYLLYSWWRIDFWSPPLTETCCE